MHDAPDPFIIRWQHSDGAERANYQLFLYELCDHLAVPRSEPSQCIEDFNTYVFDKSISIRNPHGTTSRGFINHYRKNIFVLEAKQGSKPFMLQTVDANNLTICYASRVERFKNSTIVVSRASLNLEAAR